LHGILNDVGRIDSGPLPRAQSGLDRAPQPRSIELKKALARVPITFRQAAEKRFFTVFLAVGFSFKSGFSHHRARSNKSEFDELVVNRRHDRIAWSTGDASVSANVYEPS
jgi:hypothetical protein